MADKIVKCYFLGDRACLSEAPEVTQLVQQGELTKETYNFRGQPVESLIISQKRRQPICELNPRSCPANHQ